jgi:ion channel-forming bestrophin family protein
MRSLEQFWRQSLAIQGSITPHILPHVIGFGLLAWFFCLIAGIVERQFQITLGLAVGPFEIFGGVFAILLVLRTNAGYDRWWEARKLWGGIVNQSRNLAISVLSYGPIDLKWRAQFVGWVSAFSHAARASLRGETASPEIAGLLGADAAAEIARADHAPSAVALKLATLLQEARTAEKLDNFSFLQADRERAMLIDHLGGCERILKTPLPVVYAIKIRLLIVLFLITLPLALLHTISQSWQIAIITMLVAYFLVALDQIGIELQNPFSKESLDHLPLDEITAGIERNLKGMLPLAKASRE